MNIIRKKRYWSRSQVDGRRIAKVSMFVFEGDRVVTFSRETDKERRRWCGSALHGKRYTVSHRFVTIAHTDDFKEAFRAFVRACHG